MNRTSHVDTFARDRLPPTQEQPEFIFELPELNYPERLNCATELLERGIAVRRGSSPCILAPGVRWTYADLHDRANRIARVLVEDLGLVPGNRVLLRGGNSPMMAACWFAVMKAGGIAVTTMPLLRAKELTDIISKAEVSHALCDLQQADALQEATAYCPTLRRVRYFNDPSPDGLEETMAAKSGGFDDIETAADDTCIIAFTSGTTGVPKGTMHFHRDVMAICDSWPRSTLRATQDDVFIGSPPLAFTFGLGGLLLFPVRAGASTVLLEKAKPEFLLAAIAEYRATILFTTPTAYRAMAPISKNHDHDHSSLRKCVSAGEALPAATRKQWKDATGIEIIDGLGTTEMLHIFVSADESNARPGATGKPIAGYRACIMDDAGNPVPAGVIGNLAVKGPTGCRYLADGRQTAYVKNGWNYTGDAYSVDPDGYFVFHGRTDDMIISAGYNIGAPEVEGALLQHPAVKECAVVGVPDDERGQIIKAFVVPRDGLEGTAELTKELQDFVKSVIAPYKYPRSIEFRSSLPTTETGKLQRFKLRGEQVGTLAAGDSKPQSSPNLFQRKKLIRFAYCDPAGIVFYPQYFVLFNEVVEDWFAEVLEVSFGDLNVVRRMGIPTVRVECEFLAPSRLGDLLCMDLSVQKVGASSIAISIKCHAQGTDRVRANVTLVATSLDTARAIPLPGDIREKLESFQGIPA
jgi:2-aminobenzoate-CoA ligase